MKKKFTFLIAALMLLTMISQHIFAQTTIVTVGDTLWRETFKGTNTSTNFSATSSWGNYIQPQTYVASDASSLTYSSSNAMLSSTSSTNMNGAHVWLNKSVNGYIQITGIKLYNAKTVQVCWSQATSGSSCTVKYQFDGSGDFQTLSTCSGPNAGYVSDTLNVANHNTIALQFYHPSNNSKNTRIDNLTLKVYAVPTHKVTYAVSPSASGNVTGVLYGTSTTVLSDGAVNEGGKVTLTAATASAAYTFSSWNVSGSNASLSSTTDNPTIFTMGTADATVTANFISAGPTVSTDSTSLNFGPVAVGTSPSPTRTVQITHANLSADLTLTVPTPGFTVSPASITQGAASPTNVIVTFTPTAIQSYDGNLQISGGGLGSPINVPITASGTCSAPATALAYPDYELTLTGASVSETLTPTESTGNGGTITYAMASNPGGVGSVDAGTGVFTTTAKGTYVVTATQALNGTICGASVNITIVVNDTAPTCTIEPDMWDFGKVLTDSVVTKVFTVTTTNLTCDLDVSIENTVDGFSVSHSTIEEGSTTTEVTVTFAPTAETLALTPVLTISGDCLEDDTEAIIGGQGDAGYTVTFNAWSGSCDTTSMRVIQGDTIAKLPTASPSAQCAEDGWTFLGWATAKVDETPTTPTVYTSNYEVTSTDTLHAVYNSGASASSASVTYSTKYSSVADGTAITNDTIDSYTITTFAKGTNSSNAPKYYSTGTAIRCYGGNTITVNSSRTIDTIAITFGTGDGTNTITANVGSYSDGKWYRTANSFSGVTFTIGGTTGNRRWAALRVVYAGTATYNSNPICLEQVATPNITLDASPSYPTVQTTQITCETPGATIYYTTDGSNPDNTSTIYNSAITIDTVMTIKAIAYATDMAPSEIASKTYDINLPLTTMDEIFAKATGIGSTPKNVNVVFDNWLVSGVKGNNAYVTDNNGKGFIIYKSSHGFAVNDTLSGTVMGTPLQLYNGSAEFTNLTTSTTGLTVRNGSSSNYIVPITKNISELSGVNTGSVITVNNVTYDGSTYLEDASSNKIKPNNLVGYEPSSFVEDHDYNVTGVFVLISGVKEIAPRRDADIVEAEYAINLTGSFPAGCSIGTSGAIEAAKYEQNVTLTKTVAAGCRFIEWHVTNDATDEPITVTNDVFEMPKSSVTVTATIVNEYAITCNVEPSGKATVTADPNPALEGQAVTISITGMESGYALKSLTACKTGEPSTTVTIGAGNVITMPAYAVTVNAVFSNECTVTYKPNTMTGADHAVTYGDGADVTVASIEDIVADWEWTITAGKTLDKWTTNADGTGTTKNPGDVIEDISADWILWAQWRDLQYHVLFSVNGVIVDTIDVNYNTAIGTLPTSPSLPPLTFLGWSSTSPTGATDVTASWKPTGAVEYVTVYAVFGATGQNTLEIVNTDFGTYDSDYTNDTISSVIFKIKYVGNYSSSIQFKKNQGGIYNLTNLNRIDSIRITYSSAPDITVKPNTSASSTSSESAITPIPYTNAKTYVFSGNYGYFLMTNSATTNLTSIVIYYQGVSAMAFETISGTQEKSDFPEGKGYVVEKDAKLTFHGTNTADAKKLIVEDGGQLYIDNGKLVKATILKNVKEAPAKAATKWYTIASPVKNANVATATNLTTGTYDLYRYDEPTMMWENYKAHSTGESPDFTTLDAGRGYLYRHDGAATLVFEGAVNGDATTTYDLTVNDHELPGFHLIGNPYSHDIFKGHHASETVAIDDDNLNTGFYKLTNSNAWLPKLGWNDTIHSGEGILVQANEEGTLTINNSDVKPTADKYDNDFVMFSVGNGIYDDVTYALFDEGVGLSKVNHRNAEVPMLYVSQAGSDYAIATMSDEVSQFNMGFKAATTGRYTLKFKTKGYFDYLHVIDRLTGDDVDMLLEGSYTFLGTPQDAAQRFIVRLAYKPNYSTDSEVFAYQSGSDIMLTGYGTLQVFDVMGRFVMSREVNGGDRIHAGELAKGVYVLRIVGEEVKTQKIVLE